jgi:hypothetical protein
MEIINSIDKYILYYGITKYINQWKKKRITVLEKITNYLGKLDDPSLSSEDNQFKMLVREYVRSYHIHSSIHFPEDSGDDESMSSPLSDGEQILMPPPLLIFDAPHKIGIIKIFGNYAYAFDDHLQPIYDAHEHLIKNALVQWQNECQGLIIDLSDNYGGRWDHSIRGLSSLFTDGTIFGEQINNNTDWNNLINGKIEESQTRIPIGLNFAKPIIIIVSSSTNSAGELISYVFKDWKNCHIIGYAPQTKGNLHDIIGIDDELYHLKFPGGYISNRNGERLLDEKIDTEFFCDTPYQKAIQLITLDQQQWSCSGNHWEIFYWLAEIFHLEFNSQQIPTWDCADGHQEIIRWLTEITHETVEKIYTTIIQSLSICYERGYLHKIQWLTRIFNLDMRNVHAYLYTSCTYGQLEVAQWLVETYHLTTKDILMYYGKILYESCRCGHLTIVQWLVERFQLSSNDICSNHGSLILQFCVSEGQLDILKWLVKRFHLSINDICDNHNAILQFCVSEGHLDMFKWLVKRFHLSINDICDNHNAILQFCVSEGHLDILKWLVKRFHLLINDICDNHNAILQICARGGHLDMLEWFTKNQ